MKHRVEVRERNIGAGAIAAALAAVVLLVVSLTVPPMAQPTAGKVQEEIWVTRVCPSLEAGVQVGVGADGSGLVRAPLADAGKRTEVRAPGTFAQDKEPQRLSAPLPVPFWGVVLGSQATGIDAGLSLAPCRKPRSEFWFTGVRSNAGAQATIDLVNLDVVEAAVNVTVFGPNGPLPTPGGRGVVVAAQSRGQLALGPLVDSPDPVTVQVTTSSGRVAAVVRQRTFDGPRPLGGDWISPAAAPASEIVVPAVPGGDGPRTLVVGNPTDRTAQVTVDVLGSDGPYPPVGAEQVDIPAQSTRTFSLEGALQGKAAALRLRATREVVAAVESRGAKDWTTLTTAAPMGAKAVVTVPAAGARLSVTWANPTGSPAHTELRATDAAGTEVVARTADVAPGASLVVDFDAAQATTLTLSSDQPNVRLGIVETGPVGGGAGLAALAVVDPAAASGPAAVVTMDPHAGI